MRSLKQTGIRRTIVRLLTLVGILGLLGAACKSPTSPKGKGEADISINNDYGVELDIYLDGAFQFRLRWGSTIEIDNVTLYHEYRVEAREPGTGKLVDSTLIDVQSKTEYTWTINPAPRILVINYWTEVQGEKLAISMDGVWLFNLDRGESRWIMEVGFGERFLAAVNLSTGREVASTSFQIDDNDTYQWDIKRITPN